MGTSARNAGGKARNGALQGEGINTGAGMPHVAGPKYRDEFVSTARGARHGDMAWDEYGGGTFQNVAPASAAEFGVYEILAGASVPGGTVYSLHQSAGGVNPVAAGGLMIGSVWSVKAAPNYPGAQPSGWLAWAGFIDDHTLIPAVPALVDFVGVRYGAGSWDAVCILAGVETSATLVPVASDAVFDRMGFERTDQGYQFFTLDTSNPRRVVRTDGPLILQNLPAAPMTPVIGVGAPEGPQGPSEEWGVHVDWYDLGGRTAR